MSSCKVVGTNSLAQHEVKMSGKRASAALSRVHKCKGTRYVNTLIVYWKMDKTHIMIMVLVDELTQIN